MITINSKKVLAILSSGFKKAKEAGQKALNKLQEDINYIKESTSAIIVDSKKNIFVLLDKSKQVIYFKEIDLLQKIKHIEENAIIKIDDESYQIVKIEDKKYEYLLKKKDKYKTLYCYKILVSKI